MGFADNEQKREKTSFETLFNKAGIKSVNLKKGILAGLTFEAMPSNPDVFVSDVDFPLSPIAIALTPTNTNKFTPEQLQMLEQKPTEKPGVRPKLNFDVYTDASGREHGFLRTNLCAYNEIFSDSAMPDSWAKEMKSIFKLDTKTIEALVRVVVQASKDTEKPTIIWSKIPNYNREPQKGRAVAI